MPNSATPASARRGAVFAAGHLGELTWQVPVELVDAVLAETRTAERRLRALPSRVGVYFVLALCLFPGLGYRKVWAKLTAAPRGRKTPSAKAFRDLRRRLGAAPMRALFEVLAGPVAAPHTPGVRFGRYRTVAFDGCVSFKVPDTDRNRSWLGKLKASLGTTGYPVIRLMTVVETGTRALLGAVFGAPATGEIDYARRLLPVLRADMLVLVDRGFDAEAFLTELAGTGAQFLARLRNNRKLPVLARLDDGSHLSRMVSWPCGSSPPTSPSPAPTAPATPPPTGWPPPCATRATIPRAGSSPSTTNAGNTRSPTWRCTTPSPNTACCARPIRPGSNRNCGPC